MKVIIVDCNSRRSNHIMQNEHMQRIAYERNDKFTLLLKCRQSTTELLLNNDWSDSYKKQSYPVAKIN